MKCSIKLLALIFLVAGLLATISCGAQETSTAPTAGNIVTLKAELEKGGFIVQEGKLAVVDVIGMANAGLLPSCYGNNPSTPYMSFKLPPAPGQTSTNYITDAPLNPADQGLWIDYHLRPDEAILFVGKTPPEASYFSYRSYLAGRFYPGQNRPVRIFASLGDTLNNMTLKTDADDRTKPFDSNTIIVSTGDQGISKRVFAAAQSAGYPEEIMNVDIIPQSMVNLGLDQTQDSITVIHRTAFFADETAGSDYMNNPPAVVLRLTPREPALPDPYAMPELQVRGTGDTRELDLAPDLAKLRQAIISRYQPLPPTELVTSMWLFEGYDAIQRGSDVIGENRDTTYLSSDNFTLGDDPNEFVIVYGVNHAATNKVTYANFGLYGTRLTNGVGAIADKQFQGTAEAFLPDNPNAKYLYVWKVARRCNGDSHCLEIPWGQGAAGIELDEPAFVGFRAYLEEPTKVGPTWQELLYDQVIKFGPG